jgi:hypothetical protein
MKARVVLAAMTATVMFAGSTIAQPQKEKDRPNRPAQPATPATPRPGDRQPATPATPAQPGGEPDSMAEMQKWMEIGTPGPEHKRLEPLVGRWNVATKFWMQGPDKPPEESTAVATYGWILDGRYLKQDVQGEMSMGGQKMPFTGLGYTGYDKTRKKYVGTWMDSMSTMIMTSDGDFDQATNTFNFAGSYTDPDGKTVQSRETLKLESADRIVYTMYHTEPGGQEAKMGEIIYTRAGGAAPAGRPPTAPGVGSPPSGNRPGGGGGR